MKFKRKLISIISIVLILSTLMSIAVSAETYPEEPDGGTFTATDHLGTGKQTIVYIRDNSTNKLLKKFVINGPAGDYFVEGLVMWGYSTVDTDFPWHLMVSCELCYASSNTFQSGRANYYQIGSEFTKILSPSTYEATVYCDPHTPTATVKHIKVDQNGSESLYSSSTAYLTFGKYFSQSKKTISNYTLTPGYKSSVSGNFHWTMLDASPNMPLSSYSAKFWSVTFDHVDRCYYDDWKIDIIFSYTLNHWNVKYNANGGSGAPATQTKWHGVPLTLTTDKPTRTGYTFLGWSTSSTATSATYSSGQSYTSNSGKTLYAVWSKNSYTVSYNANGGSGAPSSQTKKYNETLALSSVKPTRSGYTFKGWSTSSAATSPSYYAGGSYTSNSGATLYAVWEKNATPTPVTYTVSYNANGGTGAPSSQTKTQNVTLTLSTKEPTRSGYEFLGWSTSSSATYPTYYAGSSYTANASTTLYAVWARDNSNDTYTVSYNANGGSGAPSSQTKRYGVSLTLSSTIPTRSGYSFLGWSTSSTATSPTYYAGGTYSANAGATLYAVWQKDTVYTVSYNANGGTGAPSSQTKAKNSTLYLSTQTPTRDGYFFLGWSTSSTATTASYEPGDAYTTNASMTLYAVWEEDNTPEVYSVRYNSNGGNSTPATQYKTEGVPLTLTTEAPTRSGHKFLGWSESSTATTPTYYSGSTYSTDASTTLYAVWREDNYEFSISNLTVTPASVEQFSDVSVSVRVDSWDRNNAYYDLPVELLYNGSVVATRYVDLSAYGLATLNFTLNVGERTGNNTITARINWNDHYNETNTSNNSVSTSLNVTPYEYDLYIESVAPNASYREGTTVITSYKIYNDSERDVLPSQNNTVSFNAYYYNNGTKVNIANQTWSNAVIPAGNSNLVYFKWTVPTGLANKTVYCSATVNSGNSLHENESSNNTTQFSTAVISALESQPDDTYYSNKPNGFTTVSAPSTSNGTATWNQWVYENGAFSLKSYGIGISTTKPSLSPDDAVSTAIQSGSRWTIKSGYGIKLTYNPYMTSLSGYSTPSSDAYTSIQTAYSTFPEFKYSDSIGKYAELRKVSSGFAFEYSDYSNTNAPVHFIPVWYTNGSYVVSVTAGDCWTPAGMISTTVNTSNLTVNGTMYDDYYVGG